MIPVIRQKEILRKLKESKDSVLTIDYFVKLFNVSHMTIRRDIEKLEQAGKVTTVSGGVQSIEPLYVEASHHTKENLNHPEKQGIGQYAASLIEEHSTIYLDAGTTTFEIATHIHSLKDLVVITNDFVIAAHLIEYSQCTLYHTGGQIDRPNLSAIGRSAANFLKDVNIDTAFISTSSFNMSGISTPNEDKIFVKKAVIEAGIQNILVTDSSKFGKVGTFKALDIDAFDKVITDSNMPVSFIKEMRERNIEIITVDIESEKR